MIAYQIDSIMGLTIYCAYGMFITVHIGCVIGTCFCRCCPCKPWIKRITLEVAQYLYGPSSIAKKNQKEESESIVFIIQGMEFQDSQLNISVIACYNALVIGLIFISAMRLLVSQETIYGCNTNHLYYECWLANETYYLKETMITDCSEHRNENLVCYYINFSPVETIGFIGGFMKIVPPLGFKISTFLFLWLPSYLKQKSKCASNFCLVLQGAHLSHVFNTIIFFLLIIAIGLTIDDFTERIIFRNTMSIGKGTATKFGLFMAIILTMTMCPWDLLLEKEKEKSKINVLQPEEGNEERKPLISNGGTATKASSL